MPASSRRRLLTAALSSLTLPSLALLRAEAAAAEAAAAKATPPRQAPGFYRYRLGTFEITVVSDGMNRLTIPEGFVTNASRAQVNAALSAAFMEPDVFLGPYNPIVVNTGDHLALIDAGNGEAAFRASGGATGQLLANLAAAGIAPESIDTVILSHYHADHINGLLRADDSLAFPTARIIAPAPEHRYWMNDEAMRAAPTPRIATVFRNVRRVFRPEVLARLQTCEWGESVIPGITAVATPGQTPGHTAHIVASGNERLFVQADVTHAPYLFVRHPEWHPFYDHDPVQAEATRHDVYERLVRERWLVQGYHYPFPGLAHIERAGSGYREVPVVWMPSVQAVR
jgi:glyoxylase-like metal-dependent hydrolase (beta-lactamase superfamily II)